MATTKRRVGAKSGGSRGEGHGSERKKPARPRTRAKVGEAARTIAEGVTVRRTRQPAVSRRREEQGPAQQVALAVAAAALDKKAESVEIIDVRGRVDYADFLVVMSGRSDRHVAATAQGIEESLRQQGTRCMSVEGLPQAQWVLMDFGDVIAHIFVHDKRAYYDLEGLWMDASRVPVAAQAGSAR